MARTATAPAEWVLRIGAALGQAGLAWRARTGPTSLDGFALMELGWSPEAAGRIDEVQTALATVLALWLLLAPRVAVCLVAAVLFGVEAAAHGVGHERFSHLAPFAWACRVALPLGLALVLRRGAANPAGGEWLLRLAAASTFAAHGLEAWARHPAFVDLVLAFDLRLAGLGLGLGLDEATANDLLTVVAVHDVALAVLVLAVRWPPIAGWMAVWAGAAALARTLQGGLELWGETAIRAPNAAVPLAVALLVAARRPRGPDLSRPES